MNNTDILEFIHTNFSNGRLNLLPKINAYLANPVTGTRLFDDVSKHITTPFRASSYSSGNPRNLLTKKDTIGDIADIYIFCLNDDIDLYNSREDFDWDFTSFLRTGKELHLCTLWVNWFLPVYYIETSYELVNRKKRYRQYGRVVLSDEKEQQIVDSIERILLENKYHRLDLDFLQETMHGISTDCSEKKRATIFECLFSDLCVPAKHFRRITPKGNSSQYPELSFIEYLDDQRERLSLEAEIYHNGYSPLTIEFDNDNRIIQTVSRVKNRGKKRSAIILRYE